MSQMNLADRQLETALTPMFQQKVTENRSTMRYWPAVSDRLGEQVSKSPWEHVMDAINKPRIPFNTRYIYAAGSALVVVIAVLLLVLFLNTGDGSDGESVPASAPESQIVADEVAQEAVVVPALAPPAIPVIPASVPEPGSDDEQILALLEKQVRAINAGDYGLLRETCSPSTGKLPTAAQVKQKFEDFWAQIVAPGVAFIPEGYNVRNVEVKLLRAPFAQTNGDVYQYDLFIFENLRTWEKVDGKWYHESDKKMLACP